MAAYLVTQATGQQSQSVIKHLLAAGAKVHAVVRNLEKVPPALKHPDITLFQGESHNFEEILRAAQGCKGAFLNTYPYPGLEARQATGVVEACKEVGVDILVASTTFHASNKALWNDATTEECGLLPYFTSKAAIEDIVRRGSLKAYTILRPGFIHFDYLLPSSLHNYPTLSTHGELEHSFEEGATMPHTDANDIGKYGAAALLDPAKFGGHEINLGNEALSVEASRDIVARVSGKDVRLRKRTDEEVEAAKTTVFFQKFQLWASKKDISIDEAAAKEIQAKFGIPFTSIETALRRDKARLVVGSPA